MKTQILKSQISKAIVLAIMIAVAAPTANAQRRTVNGNEKNQKTEQQNNRQSTRTVVQNNRENTNHQNRYGDHPSSKHNEKVANKGNNDRPNHHGHQHWDKPGRVKVYVHPPVINNWCTYNYHHHPISFRRVPKKSMWVFLDGENYLMYKNRFYLGSPLGFYRVTPPKYFNQLPDGCELVLVKGQKIYNFHGIIFIDTPLGFKIIAS